MSVESVESIQNKLGKKLVVGLLTNILYSLLLSVQNQPGSFWSA